MNESKERLVQGTLDEVLENEETEDLGDPLGEKPIGRTPTGLRIYPSEPSVYDQTRKYMLNNPKKEKSSNPSRRTKPKEAIKFPPPNPIDGSSGMREIGRRDMIRVRSKS